MPISSLDFSTEQDFSPEIGKLFAMIERTEDWTLDNRPGVRDRLMDFCLRLSDPLVLRRLVDADKNSLLFFLVYISASRAFRLIDWMDAIQGGFGTFLLNTLLERDDKGVFANVSDSRLAGIMIQRFRMIRNALYLQRFLHPTLLDDILYVVENYREERKNGNEE